MTFIYNSNVYLSPAMLYIHFGVDTVQNQKSSIHITLLQLMHISQVSITANFYGQEQFFVEHTELVLCVQFQVNGLEGVKIEFLYSVTI